jgi:hypothetical protein
MVNERFISLFAEFIGVPGTTHELRRQPRILAVSTVLEMDVPTGFAIMQQLHIVNIRSDIL